MPTPPIVERGPREILELPQEEIEIPEPGPMRPAPSTSLTSLLLPAGFTIVGLAVMIAVGSTMGGQTLLLSMAISLPMMLGSYLVSFINYSSQKRTYKREVEEREKKYRALLQRQRQDLELLRDKTQAALRHRAPDPLGCLGLAERQDPCRLWARAPYDEDFLALRLGMGAQPFQVTVKAPRQQSALDADPLIQAAQDLATEFAAVPEVPICLPLRQTGVAGLAGPRKDALNAARSLSLQIATHHSPHDVKIVAIYPANEAEDWDWLRWLPHAWADDHNHRFLAQEQDAAHELLNSFSDLLNRRKLQLEQDRSSAAQQHLPNLVFLLADPRMVEREPILPLLLKQGQILGAYSIFLADRVAGLPKECQAIAKVGSGEPTLQRSSTPGSIPYNPDQVSVELADRFSRTMAPIRLKRPSEATEIPAIVSLLEVLDVERVENLNIAGRWKTNDPYRSMAVPVGRRAGGKLQCLDLHEPKPEPDVQSGHGPHALIAGMVGSGKSELVQSFVASLAVHFHPHEVVFVLLDFKPPGMAKALEGLPHVVNTIDLNDLDMVPRALKSLERELMRRGQLFERVGVTHIDDYIERHRKHDIRAQEILPYVVLIVDEFTVLREKLPETMKRFEQVAIRGRAFGFRMILATQKPAGVVSQQVDSNTGLRLCLRVAKPEDSQEVLKCADAASLTSAGRVYMRVGKDIFELFQAAHSRAHYAPGGYVVSDPNEIVEVMLDGSHRPLRLSPKPKVVQEASTQIEALVAYIRTEAQREGINRLPGPWLPPLPVHLSLEEVRPMGGWDGTTWQPIDRWLRPVIGLQDDPANQSQPMLQPDLGRKGHLFVCGGPASDNRMVLRTLVTSLVRDHSPAELHIYCLDLGSFGLQVFERLPHVGAVIHPDEPKRIKRLFRWLLEELESRKKWLAQHGAGNLAECRTQGTKDSVPAALMVVVDNLAALRDDLERVDDLARLAREGREVDIHLILAGDQTTASVYKVLENVALKIALQFDAADYKMIVGSHAPEVFLPRDMPGRGLCAGPPLLECQVAAPIAGKPGAEQEAELEKLAEDMHQASITLGYKSPTPIHELLSQISLDELVPPDSTDRWPAQALDAPLCVPIGRDDLTLDPISIDLVGDGPHFLVTGPQQGGKTTVLTTWLLGLARTFPPEIVQFVVFDSVMESLAPLKDLPHVGQRYATSPDDQIGILDELKKMLETRRTEKQKRGRPAMVLVIDDYQFTTSDDVKRSLQVLAPHYYPYGFHIILAVSLAAAGTYDQLRNHIRDHHSGLFVGGDDRVQFSSAFDLNLPQAQARQALPPGRGYLVRHGQPRLVQVATPGDKAAVQQWVQRIAAADKARHN